MLLFDSNAASNSDVRKARRALAQELAARGAKVLIADVPPEPAINGPDDLIALAGDEAMISVLDTARPFAECAVTEAEQAVTALESDKKSDPFPAIEAIAEVDEAERRAMLIARLVVLRVPGATRKVIEQRVRDHRVEAEADRRKAADACKRGRFMAMDVNGAALLGEVYVFLRRFVVSSDAQARVVVLWMVHTYVFLVADSTPYLSVTSPEKRSGKTRILEVCKTMVAKPWLTGRVTAAVLYRKIDAESPTLLLDESDAAFKSGEEYSEALRGILNTGHGREGTATCCVGKGAEISYQDFSTFSPKMIAGIGKLPDTVADRSIPTRLQRKTRDEKVERFRRRDAWTEAAPLRDRLEAWAAQNVEPLRGARPELPEELSDRQQYGAEPLLAIADLVGGEWPEAARRALVSLCCGAQAADDSNGALLLSDIRQIFKTEDTGRLPSTELASALAGIETSPWGEWNKGKPITQIGLAKLLKPFDISPHNIRIESRILKGYEVNDFEDAWARYLSPERNVAAPHHCSGSATPLHAHTDAVSSGSEDATRGEYVAGQKVEKPLENVPSSGVAHSETHTGAGPEEEL